MERSILLKPQRVTAIRQKFDDGWSIGEISRHYKHAFRTVRGALTDKQRARIAKLYKCRAVATVTAEKIMEHRAQGLVMKEIGAIYDISRQRAYALLKAAGIVLPPYHTGQKTRVESAPAS